MPQRKRNPACGHTVLWHTVVNREVVYRNVKDHRGPCLCTDLAHFCQEESFWSRTQFISAPKLSFAPVKCGKTGGCEVNSGLGRQDRRETSVPIPNTVACFCVTAWNDIPVDSRTSLFRPGGLALQSPHHCITFCWVALSKGYRLPPKSCLWLGWPHRPQLWWESPSVGCTPSPSTSILSFH